MTEVEVEERSEGELAALLVEAAADPDGGWFEAEQMGQTIARLGPVGVRVLVGLLIHPEEHVAAGAVHGLGRVVGWPAANAGVLGDLAFDPRPAVSSRTLDAMWGHEGGYVCHLPEIADRVARELNGHESGDVRSSALAYLSVCASDRHLTELIRGLSDEDWSVRTTAIVRLAYLNDPDLLAKAGPHVWPCLDDESLDVRDDAQMFVERHAWPSSEGTASVPMTTDDLILVYSRTRIDLVPLRGQPVNLDAFTRALESDQLPTKRRGAADELFEQTILIDDEAEIAGLLDIATRFRDDADERVRQALEEAITFVREYK